MGGPWRRTPGRILARAAAAHDRAISGFGPGGLAARLRYLDRREKEGSRRGGGESRREPAARPDTAHEIAPTQPETMRTSLCAPVHAAIGVVARSHHGHHIGPRSRDPMLH